MTSDTHHRVAILVYGGVNLLDITGPAEVPAEAKHLGRRPGERAPVHRGGEAGRPQRQTGV
ncbi:hypothetical protein C1I97_04285 [Streptomyces sp. NTH33]|nr:hypothetical protein C1I97_04285 [Streptomyces sp. NTH33]